VRKLRVEKDACKPIEQPTERVQLKPNGTEFLERRLSLGVCLW
jgi:hypothetical protein